MKENWTELEKVLIEKAWQDDQFRQELIANPKKVIEQELGCVLPAEINIKVVVESPDTLYLRLPANPDNLTDEELERVAGGLNHRPCPDACVDCPGFGYCPCNTQYCQH